MSCSRLLHHLSVAVLEVQLQDLAPHRLTTISVLQATQDSISACCTARTETNIGNKLTATYVRNQNCAGSLS